MAARESRVLGPDGRPVQVQDLIDDIMPPSMTGVRSAWSDAIASGLTPGRLASIIRAANASDTRDLLTLAEDMEERDTHYASVLGQRKRAVSGIEPIVQTAGDERIANEVERLIQAPIFADMVDDLLDAIAKGFAVVQPIWQYGKVWRPIKYLRQDQRHFQFDRLTGRDLLIRSSSDPDGRPIPPYALIVHRPHLKSGLTARAGLARLVAWTFMLKTYTLQDWAAFLEIFGMPLRVGKYDRNAKQEEKRVLLRAVRELATDAAAIIPQGMEIEFIEAKGGSGNAVFGAMADYLDKQVSKAVVGQTMTTDEGSSRAQSEVHDEVRIDIRRADARQLGTTINRDLIAPFVSFNWGPDTEPPKVVWPVEDPEDIKTFSEAVARLVPLGQPVAVADVAKRMNLRVPDKGEAILMPPARPTPEAPPTQKAAACPGCGETHLASEAQQLDDPLVAEALANWEEDMGPIVSQLMAVARRCSSFNELRAELATMTLDTDALADRLAMQTMKARGDGDIG